MHQMSSKVRDRAQQIANRKQALDIDLEDAPDEFKGKAKNKSCLVVLHCPPLIFENWKNVFIVQKYTAVTAPHFSEFKKNKKKKKKTILFENFDLLKISFIKLLLSTCLHV